VVVSYNKEKKEGKNEFLAFPATNGKLGAWKTKSYEDGDRNFLLFFLEDEREELRGK
jgi:hypothetical protein